MSSELNLDNRMGIREHLLEAIEVNVYRKSIYSKLTNGASKSISNMLIWSERISLISTWFLDKWSQKYHRAGIPIFVKDLEDMPPKEAIVEQGQIPAVKFEKITPPDVSKLIQEMKVGKKREGYFGMLLPLRKELERLEVFPDYYCMYRHILESLARTLQLTRDEYQPAAKSSGLADPIRVIGVYVTMHMWIIKSTVDMDKKAARFQDQGIAIIAQDVPAIPWH